MPKCFKCGEPSNVSRDGVYFCDFHNRKQDEEEKKQLNRFKFLNSIIDNTYKIVIIIIVLISILVVLSLILPSLWSGASSQDTLSYPSNSPGLLHSPKRLWAPAQ